LFINRANSNLTGLFGYTAPYATIFKLGLANASVTGNEDVGIVVGYNSNSTISECFTSGEVNGNVNVGGLIGTNVEGVLKNSYSLASVNGMFNTGGVCGLNQSNYLENTYATGPVTGSAYIGGIAGANYGLIVSSFWNTQTSGLTGMNDGVGNQYLYQSGVHGKTTAQLTDLASFTTVSSPGLSVAWDFYGNPNDDNQTEDFWHIDEFSKSGYPFLTWENSNTITVCVCNKDVQYFPNAGTSLKIESTNTCDVTVFHLKTNSTPTIQGQLPSGIVNISPRYWVSEQTCGCPETPNFSYTLSFDISGIPGIDEFETLTILTRADSNSAWENIQDIGGILDYSLAPDTLRVFSMNTFNHPLNAEYTVGGGEDNPLPVALSDFSGLKSGNGISLNWSTDAELDNLGFNILRNGEQIASYNSSDLLKGKGTTSQKHTYQYTDFNAGPGKTYVYQLQSVDVSGLLHLYDAKVTVLALQEDASALAQNYPNPFNPTTTISYNLSQAGRVNIKIFDMLGKVIVNETIDAARGNNAYTFNGGELSSGVYFYRLTAQNFTETKKMMLLK
jgi:hypothetical protein